MSTREDFKQEIEQLKAQLEQIRRQRADEKRETEQAEAPNRKTTLEEYLQACHELVLSKIGLDTDGYLASRAPSIQPTVKHCPAVLTPWGDDFFNSQRAILQEVADTLPANERLFERISTLEAIGDRVRHQRVRSEYSFMLIHGNCIEDPVCIIVSALKRFVTEKQRLRIDSGVYFEMRTSNISDESDSRDTANPDEKRQVDPISVFRDTDDNQNEIVYVIDYKLPHEIQTAHLEKGLRKMSIHDEVYPHDDDERVAAIKRCHKWGADVDYVLDKITRAKEEAAQKKYYRVPVDPNWQPKPVKLVSRNPRLRAEPAADFWSGNKHGASQGGATEATWILVAGPGSFDHTAPHLASCRW
ncbi:hypothetical protein O1611_g8196 [Lasiodiplodia mahajangana]|uniref:Uncharacterized protein n=1 Tax=Lasiodiplodia mahajangana TaxID=1108764 RepID=A0ACC2JE00_9PEZI|nr:hypothetical protein O1611_g8196 [Lasiodiplodia mahajangana]